MWKFKRKCFPFELFRIGLIFQIYHLVRWPNWEMLLCRSCLEEAGVGRELSQPEACLGKTESSSGFRLSSEISALEHILTGSNYGKLKVNQQSYVKRNSAFIIDVMLDICIIVWNKTEMEE